MPCDQSQGEAYRDHEPAEGKLVVDLVEFDYPFEIPKCHNCATETEPSDIFGPHTHQFCTCILNWANEKNPNNAMYFRGRPDRNMGIHPYHMRRNYAVPNVNRLLRTDCELRNIHGIVLHETANNNAGANMPWNTSGSSSCAHFLISKNGAVIQFNDIMEVTNHGNYHNRETIGIEFAHHHQERDNEKKDVEVTWTRRRSRYRYRGIGRNIIWAPKLYMLETDYQLTKWLCKILIEAKGLGAPSNYNYSENVKFLQLEKITDDDQNYLELNWLIDARTNQPFRPNPDSTPNPQKGCDYHRDDKLKYFNQEILAYFDPDENDPLSPIKITSHGSFHPAKICGWFISLYCWCRMQFIDGNGNTPELAFNEALKIIGTYHFQDRLIIPVPGQICESVNSDNSPPYHLTNGEIERRNNILPIFKSIVVQISDTDYTIEIKYSENQAHVFFNEPGASGNVRWFALRRTDEKTWPENAPWEREVYQWTPLYEHNIQREEIERETNLPEEIVWAIKTIELYGRNETLNTFPLRGAPFPDSWRNEN